MGWLPIPGGDDGNWGDILNDYLKTSLNNGTLQSTAIQTSGAEMAANKGQANGYASLGGGSSSYGAAIEAAITGTLWLSSNADNTTSSAGILFGLTRDTNLYRSAADTLKTDDDLVVGGGDLTLGSALIKSGAGTPEGAVTAVVGSLYLRTDGGANTTLYVRNPELVTLAG